MEAKINEKKKYISGLGILCNIPYKNIKALITYNHMINLDILNNEEKIILYINKKEKEINIKLNRYKYTDEDFNLRIIEILDTDNIDYFIEIDKFIYSRNYIETDFYAFYKNKNKMIDILNSPITEKMDDMYKCNLESIKAGFVIIKEKMIFLGIIKEYKNEIVVIPMNIIINKIKFFKCKYNKYITTR